LYLFENLFWKIFVKKIKEEGEIKKPKRKVTSRRGEEDKQARSRDASSTRSREENVLTCECILKGEGMILFYTS